MSDSEKREFELTEYELTDDEMDDEVLNDGELENETAGTHHHRHHSKAYYRYRRKKHKVKKFFRKHKLLLALIMIVLGAALVAVVLLAVNSQSRIKPNTSELNDYSPKATLTDDGFVGISVPCFNSPQPLVDELVIQYVNDENVPVLYDMLSEQKGSERLNGEKRVRLSFKLTNAATAGGLSKAVIEVADNQSFRHSQTYDVTQTGGAVELKFLFPETVYYYRITVDLADGQHMTADGSFETAASPRLISLDGVLDCRDIGGWKNADGKKIKYGMLYRGSEIDGAYDKVMTISESGVAEAHQYLGIVSDFDLRGLTLDNIPADSAFGATTKHYVFGAYEYSNALQYYAADYIRALFTQLAEPSNYPVYLHCSYGFDRTGTACYLLEAMLGLSDEDLIREFELSVFAYSTNNPREKDSKFMNFMYDFSKMSGASSQEKAENYLRSCGVTDEQIQSIKDILLE